MIVVEYIIYFVFYTIYVYKNVVHISNAVFRNQSYKHKNVNLELYYKLEKNCLFHQTHHHALVLDLA